MKFIVPLLIVLATSEAFLWGRFRSSDDNNDTAPISSTQGIEEMARTLGDILIKKLQDNNIKFNGAQPYNTKPVPVYATNLIAKPANQTQSAKDSYMHFFNIVFH